MWEQSGASSNTPWGPRASCPPGGGTVLTPPLLTGRTKGPTSSCWCEKQARQRTKSHENHTWHIPHTPRWLLFPLYGRKLRLSEVRELSPRKGRLKTPAQSPPRCPPLVYSLRAGLDPLVYALPPTPGGRNRPQGKPHHGLLSIASGPFLALSPLHSSRTHVWPQGG